MKAEAFKIGDWFVQPELLQITKEEETRKLELRTMEILVYLVSSNGNVVSKKELHNKIWGDIYVTDNALTRAVSRLRKVLDDDPLQPMYIETISKSGYRVIAPIEFNQELNLMSGTGEEKRFLRNNRWLWMAMALVLVTILSLVSFFDDDTYSDFHVAVPISTLIGPEIEQEISPDGQKILFTYSEPGANNADVYIKMLDDFSQVRFTNLDSHQGYGSWSPDGSYIAYASTEEGACTIFKEPVIGGEKIKIGNCFLRPKDFVWSPDGKFIAFSDSKEAAGPRRIFFLNVRENVVKGITSPQEGTSGDHDPEFTPNGQYLVFSRKNSGSRGDIFKMKLNDSTLTQLTFDKANLLGLTIFDDGKQIAFSSNRGGQRALWKIPFAGGVSSRFHINDRVPTHPRFSDRKNRLIYKSNIDQTNLWFSETDKAPRAIVESSRAEQHPSISNDGKKVVFISNRSGNFELWASTIDEINAVKYTSLDGSFINMPSWSPDDREIVFDARINEDNGIYIVDIASKMMRTFIDIEGDQVNARYSRDGKFIYFASNHTGSWEIWKQQVQGSEIEQVTKNGGYHLQEGIDNEYLYYTKNDTTGIWRMNRSGEADEIQVVSQLSLIDWGSWVPTESGIMYVCRSNGTQVVNSPYNQSPEEYVTLLKPGKPVQFGSPTLTVTPDGEKFILAQVINREDEIMMVDFE